MTTLCLSAQNEKILRNKGNALHIQRLDGTKKGENRSSPEFALLFWP